VAASGRREGHKRVCEQERREVVDLDCFLEPVDGAVAITEDAAGIVNQDDGFLG
jgi:hypothetical protein